MRAMPLVMVSTCSTVILSTPSAGTMPRASISSAKMSTIRSSSFTNPSPAAMPMAVAV